MFTPSAGMWSAYLEPPPLGAHSKRFWCAPWEEYRVLYERFERARLEPTRTRATLKEAIDALAQCDYVHLCASGGRTRAIQSNGEVGLVRDITDRRCLLMGRPEQVVWCSDTSVNLNAQTMQMRDVRVGATDDEVPVMERSEPMEDEASPYCLYITKDPRTTANYARALWRVAEQVVRADLMSREPAVEDYEKDE